MALNDASLEADLLAFLSSESDDAQQAADTMAAVYADYAAAGMFGASTVTIDGARESALAATLLGGLAQAPDMTIFLSALASGVATFWTAVPVVGAQSGATVGCPGAASLPAAIAGDLGTENERETVASVLAAALHAATQTVTAVVAPPPATTLPIA